MSEKKILLTGATGYLGSNLFNRIIKNNKNIVLLARKTSNFSRIKDQILPDQLIYLIEENGIEKAFSENEIDTVIHCATNYGRKQSDPLQTVEANLILPLKILHTGKKHGLRCFINTDTLLDKRVSDYSLSKRQFNDWLQVEASNIVAVNIALEHFYGPGDDKTKFVSWILDSILKNEPEILLTSGEQMRDFIYISDVVDAMLLILNWSKTQPNGYYPFEVGSGRNTPVKELVTKIAQLANYKINKLKFGAIPYRSNEVMESKVNLTKLKELNWTPQLSLEEGVVKFINEEKKLRGLL